LKADVVTILVNKKSFNLTIKEIECNTEKEQKKVSAKLSSSRREQKLFWLQKMLLKSIKIVFDK
jgi:hypothetical protein